jgi:tRNA-dihydrouridine synthase
MNFYFAPIEGLTGYIYRNAHHAFFPKGMTKYFSPFIYANSSGSLKTRELNDILPENNQGVNLVPQLLTNNADDFILTAKRIKLLGYEEINLNLGCPSGTVVSKNRGAGFLAQRAELDLFLYRIFSRQVARITVKTRIGKDNPEELDELMEIFNKYPIEELIIHPRVQKDYYKNKPDMSAFQKALDRSKNPVCYNGDIFTKEDYRKFSAGYPGVGSVMLGRGLLMNPGLVQELLYGIRPEKNLMKDFHDQIYGGYKQTLFGERNVLYKMKELWHYMIFSFSDNAKHLKRIKKSQNLHAYEDAVSCLFFGSDITEPPAEVNL